MRNLTGNIIGSIIAVICLIGFAGIASAEETAEARYGVVTSGQVYSLQQNFDAILKYYIDNHKKILLGEVNVVERVLVSGKTPDDAFVMLNLLGNAIDKLTYGSQVEKVERVKRSKAKAILAEVYLQADHNLDAFARYMGTLEPDTSFGDYFVVRKHSNLTPSHIYSLTIHSLRKLNVVLR